MSMRISELSRTSGVPVPTIKFYLREQLLPPGRATAATQADYDETHLQRLRLIRALTEVGRMSLATVRSVLQVVDLGAEATAAAVGAAHDGLPPAVPHADVPPARALGVVAELGWHVNPASASLWQLEAALTAVEEVGLPLGPERLAAYAGAALDVARVDVADVPAADPEDAVRYVVVGTVLYEPVLLALRKLAQQHLYTEGSPTPEPQPAVNGAGDGGTTKALDRKGRGPSPT
jgi:DNA-binding transcriptional MerR regulator